MKCLRKLVFNLLPFAVVAGAVSSSTAFSYLGTYTYFYNRCDVGISAGVGEGPYYVYPIKQWESIELKTESNGTHCGA
jgi:hypothetical protein